MENDDSHFLETVIMLKIIFFLRKPRKKREGKKIKEKENKERKEKISKIK